MPQGKKFLISIGGPTAVGKTGLAISLAEHFRTEIISADSRQCYRELDIGTAKPTQEELQRVPHHFINSHSLLQPLTTGDYEKIAVSKLETLFEKKDTLLVVGGTGMYHRALHEGLDFFPEIPNHIRQILESEIENGHMPALLDELRKKDPQYFDKVDHANPRRIQRALEVVRTSNKPYSSFLNQTKPMRFFFSIKIYIQMERELLYRRINDRVDQMIANGLEKEARELFIYRHLRSMQTVGYQEWWPYFEGQYSHQQAVELIKRNSRRYAKRQVTWFKNHQWTAVKTGNNIYNDCLETIQRLITRS